MIPAQLAGGPVCAGAGTVQAGSRVALLDHVSSRPRGQRPGPVPVTASRPGPSDDAGRVGAGRPDGAAGHIADSGRAARHCCTMWTPGLLLLLVVAVSADNDAGKRGMAPSHHIVQRRLSSGFRPIPGYPAPPQQQLHHGNG